MTSQSAQILPFAKFTRGGFGFSSKNRNTTKTAESDEDWYIPYHGPYEVPREPPNRPKARDSWGDPVESEDKEDTVPDDEEYYSRYGGHNDSTYRDNGGRHVEEEREGRSRDRTFSVTSGNIGSSGTIDPGGRPSTGTHRRSTVSAGPRPTIPSYTGLDAVGGVGESPVPLHRRSKEGSRISFTNIFNFGAQPRKPTTPPTAPGERAALGSFMRKPSLLQRPNTGNRGSVYNNMDSQARYNSSPEYHAANPPLADKHRKLHHQVTLQADVFSSNVTDDDYYNSYYSTLIRQQRSEPILNHHHHNRSLSSSEDSQRSQQLPFDQSSLNCRSSSNSSHPYALAIPRNDIEDSSVATVIPSSNPPRLTFTAPSHNPSSVDYPNFSLNRLVSPRTPKLRNSISSPDMRNLVVSPGSVVAATIPNPDSTPQQIATPRFVFPKAKERWLSAETWCDALLFPRPRLKVGSIPALGGSGRIVSPPGSPLGPDYTESTGAREPGVASRVLAHSRSLVDLNRPMGFSSNYTSTSVPRGQDPTIFQSTSSRPTSFAQDDLALPTPVPSMARVLEQGERLFNERQAWQMQARGSLGNNHARNLSRTRSKSLTQKGRRKGHQPQSSMEYLAAQACLGNQNLSPALVAAELGSNFHATTYTNSSRNGSHSHSSSLVKSLSKSSKSHSRNNSSGDSWSRSAAKMAKSTAAICGYPVPEDGVTIMKEEDVRITNLEGALKRDGTKVIRLADPACIPVDRGHSRSNSSTRLTPSPSNNSDLRVGIALGTPPEEDDQGDSYHPSHPYAQGGLSFSVPGPSNELCIDRGTEFAGPHPSVNSGVDIPQISDILARHKLPPHLLLHPYAQGSARDSYLEQNGLLGQFRSNDDTPKQMKMWAQLSPGIIREVLPSDLQYSPFVPEKDSVSPISITPSEPIYINDTIGVGETLANASSFHRRQDSGIGTSNADVHATPAKPQAGRDKQSQSALPEFGSSMRTPTKHNLVPSEDSGDLQRPSLTNQVVSTSPKQQPSKTASDRSTTASSSSSAQLIPFHLRNPNDLESFQDLFYRPNNNLQPTHNEAALADSPCPPYISTSPWDRNMQRRKAESGLTSLARQLSQEFELMALERRESSSQYSTSTGQLSSQYSSSARQRGSRRPTQDSLRFVFEETSHPELPPELRRPAVHAFQPSVRLPEDVDSSRASSLMERIQVEDDDDTVIPRLGIVEAVLAPPTVPSQPRPNSYKGETSSTTNHARRQPESSLRPGIVGGPRVLSGLQPPSSEATRSSFMTTSSRMSNLSDFPAPPKDNHTSLLDTYLNETLGQSELRSKNPSPPLVQEQQLFFGRNQNAGDLAETLSSSP